MSVTVVLENGNEEHIAEGRSIATADGVLFVYNGNTVDLGLIGIFPLAAIRGAVVDQVRVSDGTESAKPNGFGLPDAVTA